MGIRKPAAFVLGLILFFSGPAFGAEARLTNVIVTNTRDDLLVYMTVSGAFTGELETAILSGVPTTFSYTVIVGRDRGMWPDEIIEDVTVTHTIRYDTVKKEFSVHRSWKSGLPTVTKSFDRARQLMTEIDGFKVISLAELERGVPYRIRAKAELSEVTLPLYLHHIFFFVSLWDFTTDWYTIDFVY